MQRNITRHIELRLPDHEYTLAEIDILALQSHGFREPQPCGGKQTENRGVARDGVSVSVRRLIGSGCHSQIPPL
jgi:hypothetical protein